MMFAPQLTTAGRTELIMIVFMMVFLFLFGCGAVYVFVRQYRREKTPPKIEQDSPGQNSQ
jgi:heme/copper-type cytochrome/quinol oxidase subunit 2